MPISQWIQPNQNSFLDTIAAVEQAKSYRAQNALAEAEAAELPYERERLTKLNDARVGKAEAESGKLDYELAEKKLLFMTRFPKDRNAVLGLFAEQAQKHPHLAPIHERLTQIQDPEQFGQEVTSFAMDGLEKMNQAREDQKFTEQQKQSGIDNQFQQGALDVSRGNLAVSQANAADMRRHRGVMEQKPAAGFSMSYDAEGRPIVTYGTKSEETALGTARGQARAKAEESLPKIEDLSAATITQVDELVAHPGFESAVGATALPYASRVHGTAEADFVNRLDQLKGGAFLQAIEQLKGSGQITEVEGTKATQAVNRMSTATSEGEFRAAANNYKSVIQNSVARVRTMAAGRPALPAATAPAEIDFNSLP